MRKAPTDDLRARVFISCGQNKTTDEFEIALEIKRRLTGLGFEPYVAVEVQALHGLKEGIFGQLANSEYFVFVDFKRERLAPNCHRGSLFSNQELAIASFLNLDVLALQERGVKTDDGILQFIQANATPFSGRKKLPELVVREVRKRVQDGRWHPKWRNEIILNREQIQFIDAHDVRRDKLARYFHIEVHNRHRSNVARNCFAFLETVVSVDSSKRIPFSTFESKWEGYTLPNAHIPANGVRRFDAFCIEHDNPTQLMFKGFWDASYFLPRIDSVGRYEMTYLVVADDFPPARTSLLLTLGSSLDRTSLASRE